MAASDDARLLIQIEANTKNVEKSMEKLRGVTNSAFKAMEKQARASSASVDNIFSNLGKKASASIAAIGAAFGSRELINLSDGWTSLNNKIAAVSQTSGMQARSLSDLRVGADDARSSLEAYTDLYARLMRSSSGVAKNEEEIARATNIASKAFVAGGAAASEQAAAVLQLGQALGSGNLQGDELRSIRENAPLLAKAIADEFGTTIAGLKKLGSEGKLTSERVFKAILNGGAEIEKQFNATNATMSNGFTRIKNAMLEYVGVGGQATGVSQSITQGLIMIADNFDKVAKVALITSGVIAGVLVGRSLPAMIKRLGDVGVAASGVIKVLTGVKNASGALGAISLGAVPLIGAVVGGAVVYAMNEYAEKAATAAKKSTDLHKEWENMGILAPGVANGITELSKSLDQITAGDRKNRLKEVKEEIASLIKLNNQSSLSKLISFDAPDNENGSQAVKNKARNAMQSSTATRADQETYAEFEKLLELWQKFPTEVTRSKEALEALAKTDGLSRNFRSAIADAERLRQLIEAGLTDAVNNGFDAAAASMSDGIIEMQNIIEGAFKAKIISEEQKNQIDNIIEQFQEGKINADDLNLSLKQIAGVNLGALGANISSIASSIEYAGNAALEARNKIMALNAAKFSDYINDMPTGNAFKIKEEYDEATVKAKEFGKVQDENNAKTQKQIDLERTKAEIIKDFEKKNGTNSTKYLDDDEVTKWANDKISSDDRRRSEGKKTRGGGGRNKKDEFQKEIDSVNKHTDSLRANALVQSQLNPLIDDYGYSLTKAETAQSLLSAAQAAGIAITPELKAQIEQLAEGYAQATVEANKLAEKNDKIRDAAEGFRKTARGVMEGVVSDLRNGTSAAEIFANALNKIADKMAELALDAIFNSKNEKGGNLFTGFISGLFGKGYDQGGYTGSGGKHEPAGIVHKGEVVWSQDDVKRWGGAKMVDAMRRGYANGGIVGAPSIPSMPKGILRGGSETIKINLTDDSGRMAEIADKRIETKSGTIIEVAVNQSIKNVKRNITTYASDADARYG